MSENPLGTLTTFNPAVVRPSTTLEEVFERFDRHYIRHLPVVDEDRHIVGILSMSDVYWALPPSEFEEVDSQQEDLRLLHVCDVMVQKVHKVDLNAPSIEPLHLILKYGMHSVPVVDDAQADEGGELVGIITSTDYLREFSYGEHAAFKDPVSGHMSREIAQIHLDTTPHEALRIMTEQEWTYAAVTAGDCPVGILSRRDFCGAYGRNGTLSGLYLPDVPTVREGDLLGDVVCHLIEHRAPALAVVDRGNRMTGLLTQDNVLQVIAAALETGVSV